MNRNMLLAFIFATTLSAAPGVPANSTIGVASAVSAFSVNNATVTGSVDLSNGATLKTSVAPSDVNLQNGVAVRFATRSAGTVYENRLVLEQGAARVAKFDNYAVDARQLHIEADSAGTQAIVRVTGKTVEVASLTGSVKVTDGGAMLTRVAAGTKVAFQTGATPQGQTGAAPAEKGPITDSKVFWGTAIVCGVGAAVVGGIAAAQGKSPF